MLKAGLGSAAGSVLAACGLPAGNSQAEKEAAAKRPVTLRIDTSWTTTDRLTLSQKWLEHVTNKHPNIKTELGDGAANADKLVATFAADSQGDLCHVYYSHLPVFGPKGLLQDIGPTLAALKFDVSKVYDLPAENHWEGKRVGLTVQFNVNVWLYNQTAFLQAGEKEPTAAWTWEDFLASARRLHSPKDNRWGAFVDFGYPYPWFWAANVPYRDEKGTTTSWDTPAAREVLEWWANLALRHQVAPTPREITEKMLSFNAGHFAISSQANISPTGTAQQIGGRFQWEIAPPARHPKTGKSIMISAGRPYMATTKGKNRGVFTEAIQALIAYFDTEVQDLYNSSLQLNSAAAPLKSVAAKTASLPGVPKNYKIALEGIETGHSFDIIPGFLNMHAVILPEFSRAVNGEITIEQAAVNMKRASDEALQKAAR